MAYRFAKKLDLKVGEEKSYIVKVVGFKDKKWKIINKPKFVAHNNRSCNGVTCW